MSWKRCLIGLALGWVVACGSGESASTAPESSPIAPGSGLEAVVEELAAVAGDRAVLTLVLRLDRWSTVQRAVSGMLASEPPPELKRLLEQPLAEALEGMGAADLARLLAGLDGMDRSRPIIVRFGEAPDDLESVIAVARGLDRSPEKAIRHVVAIPAEDPERLMSSVGRELGSMCAPRGEGTFACPAHWTVHLVRDTGWLWLVAGDDTSELRGTRPPSDALRWALQERWPVAAHARLSALRGAAAHTGAYQVRRALEAVSPDYRRQMEQAGLREILATHARTAPHGAEIDEIALAFRPDPASLLFAAHLTPLTAEALRGAASNPVVAPPEAPAMPTQHLHVRSAIDLRSAAHAARSPFAFPREGPREVMHAFQACGMFCNGAALTRPLAFAHLGLELGVGPAVAERVTYEHEPALGPGVLEVHFDLADLANHSGGRDLERIAAMVPGVYLRSRIEEETWGGTIGFRPGLPLDVPSLRAAEDESPIHPPDEIACLSRAEIGVIETLGAVTNVAPEDRSLVLERGRSEVREALGCLSEPALRAEGEAYVRALEALGQ